MSAERAHTFRCAFLHLYLCILRYPADNRIMRINDTALATSHTEFVFPFIGVPNVVVHAVITLHTTANLAINLSRYSVP